jgi:hypothetical protein
MVIVLSALDLSTDEVIDACLSGRLTGYSLVHEGVILDSLSSINAEVLSLREHIQAGLHASFPAKDATLAEKDALLWMYEKRLGTSGAKVYRSAILALGATGCPFCHATFAPTIEHSFPKSTYPWLAVTPINMVPCCRDCNSERNVGRGTIAISPYVDHWLEDAAWVAATVPNPARPWVLDFAVIQPQGWAASRMQAADSLFADVKMRSRYRIAASQEFSSRSGRFLSVLELGGLEALKAELQFELDTHFAQSPNFYKTIAYKGWLKSFPVIDWYAALKARSTIHGERPRVFLPDLL